MPQLKNTTHTMAERVAIAAGEFHARSTGHPASSIAAALNGDTVVVTLHEALSPAEKKLASSITGAAQVQEFYRQLFAMCSGALQQEVGRITGTGVRDVAVDAVVHVFASGTMVQVFLLGESPVPGSWHSPSTSPSFSPQI